MGRGTARSSSGTSTCAPRTSDGREQRNLRSARSKLASAFTVRAEVSIIASSCWCRHCSDPTEIGAYDILSPNIGETRLLEKGEPFLHLPGMVSVGMSDKLTIPPRFEGFTNEQMISLCASMLSKWSELIVKEMRDDVACIETLDVYEQVYRRAKWLKTIDLILAAKGAVDKHDTPEGKLDLIIQYFGDHLGMPSHSLAGDIKRRMDWYK